MPDDCPHDSCDGILPFELQVRDWDRVLWLCLMCHEILWDQVEIPEHFDVGGSG